MRPNDVFLEYVHSAADKKQRKTGQEQDCVNELEIHYKTKVRVSVSVRFRMKKKFYCSMLRHHKRLRGCS